jgi:hypothetical protein
VNAPNGRSEEGGTKVKFMLTQNYAPIEGVEPMSTWAEEDVKAHIEGQVRLNQELSERGELVEAQALTGPELAKIVTHDGVGTPVVTDGPFPESKEFLAGYRIVDVESLERAIEIAGQGSAAPGPGGVPLKQPIEVREVMGTPGGEV